jgi:starch-binding outer membrane protein, SusD/RagB family
MKKQLLFLTLIVILSGSCEQALDFPVRDKITQENFYQNEDDAIAAINAIYDVLGAVELYCSSLWLIQDISSDDFDALETWNDPNAHQLDQYTIQATNNYLSGLWQASYRGISNANIALQKIPGIDMEEELKNRLLAEAQFLRGLYYFNLVRLFGDVPLILQPGSTINDYLVGRETADVVYSTIIDDLSLASEYLPLSYTGSDKGRATKGAALGILSKVYLTTEQWDLAAGTARQVMDLEDEGIYGLFANYADNFKDKNKNGLEAVYQVQFYTGSQPENTRIVISGLPSIPPFTAGVGIILPTDDLLASFDSGDYRYDVTFFTEYFYFQTYTFDPHVWKHWDKDTYPASKTGQSGANFPVMRYAEILLIYAEALNEANNGPTQEAYDAVNRVRARARHGDNGVLPDLNGLSQVEFRDAVLKEKRCETVNEGQRWFDLARTGNLVEYVKRAKGDKANPTEFNYVFPIPQREIDINNKLIQNSGSW